MKKLLLFCLLMGWVLPLPAQPGAYIPTDADRNNTTERIIDLHADIKIMTDGTVIVTEYLTIYAAGIDIRRGIIRNIPKCRKDRDGKKKTLPVKIRSLTRNGEPSEYRTETSYKSGDEELLVYTGSSDVLLEKGIHQYTLVYETRGHVGFFGEFDELYWNVMGGDCVYLIEHISATLYPPGGSEAIQWSCYTGRGGSTEQACNCDENKAAPTFTVSRALLPGEAFTIAVAFPRDIIQRPTASQLFWMQHRNWIFGGIIIFIVLVYMIGAWLKFGRGAPKQLVIPQFSPPEGWSAEKVRYAYKRKFDPKAFTAALLQMAVKGVIGIEYKKTKKGNKRYCLVTKDRQGKCGEQCLSAEQQGIYDALFSKVKSTKKQAGLPDNDPQERKEVEISAKNHLVLGAAMRSLKSAAALLIPIESLYKANQKCRMISLVLNLALFFIYSLLLYDYYSDEETSFFVIPLVMFILHRIFLSVIGARTVYGAKVEAELAGLRMYLETAEKHFFDQLMPPEQTPEHFEEMLPYAVALGVENQWCKKFHDVLKKYNYIPEWYDNKNQKANVLSDVLAANFLITIHHSLSSSASSPRSTYSYSSSSSSSGSSSWSSGSSGGGYSGGGGGGGGVSGW